MKGPKGNKKDRMNLVKTTFKFPKKAVFPQVFRVVTPREKAGRRDTKENKALRQQLQCLTLLVCSK